MRVDTSTWSEDEDMSVFMDLNKDSSVLRSTVRPFVRLVNSQIRDKAHQGCPAGIIRLGIVLGKMVGYHRED